MDLSVLNLTEQSNDAKRVEINHPITYEKTDLVILVVGRESTKAMNFGRLMNDEAMARGAKFWADGKGTPDLTDEEKDDLDARGAASIVVGWENMVDGGEPLPFSEEAALALMRKYPWLRRQVMRAHRNDELFFGSKPTTLSDGQSTPSDSSEQTSKA